ncbi:MULTISPECIES: hypothetical protein [unclassified Pseudomonas]|uniref:hypothetical protein n=1 Tax=unclassified Pseudomonas TaxID=196821 RepID=UPI000C8820D4|nr:MULTISPECIES: hypothetical protein [unclassified Pseudomonas]PNA02895.1 hypothetical protein C1X79_00565 [Pseudomonas sp. FW305-42]PNA27625.1 hypothetical protein C1X78_02310 [Pseudomonas sp. MPR-R1B]PNB29657.1 hypothetical protein C1X80_00855 [Pseudomonas sp. DP16D-E2]PNB45213.1 hypothetical protein C1X75_02770 [Pseudomonas sp. FW305-17]PNB63582.1 hypothetical protein C1X77_06145 [Pseudomonas sp. GW531-E2]
MANTQVFTLGVTSDQALGRSVDSLRAQVEHLRKQTDGTRLGRLIGEVIRLGLELDKVGQAERQLDNDQAGAHEAQIERLRHEGNEVERLRRLYLSLGRKPLELRSVVVASSAAVAKESAVPTLAQRKAALLEGTSTAPRPARGDPPEARSAEQGRVPLESANAGLTVLKAGAVGAGTVGVAAGAAWGARSYYQSRTPERRSEITKGLKENGGKAAAKGVTKLGLAMLKDKGEDKAEAVGAALGGVLGNLGAELLGGLTKNKQIQKYGGEIGEMIGEGLGGLAGKALHGLFSDKPAANDAPADKAKIPAAVTRMPKASDDVEEPEEEEEEEEVDEAEDEAAYFEAQEAVPDSPPATAPPASAVGPAGTAFTGLMGRAGAGNASASAARRVFRRIPGAALLDTGLQLAETYNSDASPEQKLEGYGTAAGGLGGGLAGAAAGAAIGSVVPVIGTAIGGLIGGVLGSMGGESIGGWLGKALGSGKEEPAAKPSLGEAVRAMDSPAAQPPLPAPPVATATPAVPPAPINQQFTFTANMPVTFSNSLDDPSVLQQLEAIARRQLEELMRQARSAQLADTPHIAL